MRLADMKIATRLMLGFGVLGLLIALLGGLSHLKIGAINGLFNQVIDERVPKIVAVNEIKGDVNAIAIALRNIIISSDGAVIKSEAERITQAGKRISAQLERLATQITSAQGKTLLESVNATRRAYDPLQAETMELAVGGQVFEAKAMLLEKV
ncbi:MAG: MCP four helix bundle domain-containing protein, partial [Rhodoferax sp.]